MQTTQNVNQELSGEVTPADYKAKRKTMDPAPWIKPTTMERFSEQPNDGFSVFHPRVVWPEHGGRMVRRDYLRPGDRAVSSHYGIRTVKSVRLAGTEGQTATITWFHNAEHMRHFTESYDSSLMIELLPKGE